MYACDARWWEEYAAPADGKMPWTAFPGIKVSLTASIDGVHRLPYDDKPGISLDPLRLHSGGNGGYQALNLAVLMGAARIILLGYDMQGTHWHGAHPQGLNNPTGSSFAEWKSKFATTLPDLKLAGVEVINASRKTALECFQRAALETVLE